MLHGDTSPPSKIQPILLAMEVLFAKETIYGGMDPSG